MILLTGTTGFIGSKFLKNIGADDKLKLKILTRKKELPDRFGENVEIFHGDLRSEVQLFAFIQQGATLVNMAYLSSHSLEDNLQAARNLVRICIAKKISRLVHCSTAAVVGRFNDKIITEESPCNPVTTYEKTKLEIEKIFIDELGGETEVVILRPTAVFGPAGQNLVKIARETITENYLTRTLKMSIYARRRLNLVSVENVVSALKSLTFFEGKLPHRRYIVSDDDEPENNYKDVANYIARFFGRRVVPQIPIPFQRKLLSLILRSVGRSNLNSERIYSSDRLIELGYRKKISIRKALEQFSAWLRHEVAAGD